MNAIMNQLLLEVDRLTKKYDNDTIAINDVSINLYPGDFVGLIGSNGAGKSTLINCIISLLCYDEGIIRFNNLDIIELEQKDNLFIGYSPDSSFFPEILNSYDILAFTGNMRKVKNVNQEIHALLTMTGLLPFADKPIYSYSTGMKQKLSVCVALLGNPELIILDETLNGIDPVSSFKIKKYLKNLTNSFNKTVLMSSHILETIEKYCDRIIIIDEGRLVKILSQQELSAIKISTGKDLEEIFIELVQHER
jgi:ABC-2 type transport system ATP-binding protein